MSKRSKKNRRNKSSQINKQLTPAIATENISIVIIEYYVMIWMIVEMIKQFVSVKLLREFWDVFKIVLDDYNFSGEMHLVYGVSLK